jgi:hypothetical protein
MEACVDLFSGPQVDPLASHRSSRCRTAQRHTAACRADPSQVARPCFGFQGFITFPLSRSPDGTSE